MLSDPQLTFTRRALEVALTSSSNARDIKYCGSEATLMTAPSPGLLTVANDLVEFKADSMAVSGTMIETFDPDEPAILDDNR